MSIDFVLIPSLNVCAGDGNCSQSAPLLFLLHSLLVGEDGFSRMDSSTLLDQRRALLQAVRSKSAVSPCAPGKAQFPRWALPVLRADPSPGLLEPSPAKCWAVGTSCAQGFMPAQGLGS